MSPKAMAKKQSKRLKITVTAEDIKKHWNGSVMSCPIANAMRRRGIEAKISTETYDIGADEFHLPSNAQAFSTKQSDMFEHEPDDDKAAKKKALKVLKPFSFFIPRPVEA